MTFGGDKNLFWNLFEVVSSCNDDAAWINAANRAKPVDDEDEGNRDASDVTLDLSDVIDEVRSSKMMSSSFDVG